MDVWSMILYYVSAYQIVYATYKMISLIECDI